MRMRSGLYSACRADWPRAQIAPRLVGCVGVALQLDRPPVHRLGDHAARRGALAAGGGVIRGHAGHRLVGRDEVGNQLAGILGAAADRADGGRADPEDLQEIPAFDALPFGSDAMLMKLPSNSERRAGRASACRSASENHALRGRSVVTDGTVVTRLPARRVGRGGGRQLVARPATRRRPAASATIDVIASPCDGSYPLT